MTTAFLPNCRVTILDTGNTVTSEGDEIENDVVVTSGRPAVWAQRTQRTWDPSQGRHTTVRGIRVTLRPGVVVRDGQRLRNERTGETGLVESVDTPLPGATTPTVVVTLVQISR